MKLSIVRIATAALILAAAFATAKPAQGGTLGADKLALFPKETGELGYADMKKARAMKWFPQLQEQLLPANFKQFEKFLAAAGVDPNVQVEELAWGLVPEGLTAKTEGVGSAAVPTGEQVVGVALGSFTPDTTKSYFKQQKLPFFDVRGYTLYAFGTGSGANDLFFMYFDSGTAAFGHRKLLEEMIEVHYGQQDSLLRNDKLYPLVAEANGSGIVWTVLNAAYTRLAMQQLAPEVQQFPDAAKLITRMQNMIISVTAATNIDGKFQAVCGSVDDANALGQLIQAGMLYKRYQAQTENPELAKLLDQVSVTPAGDRVTLRMSLSDEQMTSLIQRNTFALKM
jgi:hypothetical protein